MANVRLQLPDTFDLKNPDEWQCWKCYFEQFCFASGLSGESEERQISTLLYCLGRSPPELQLMRERTIMMSWQNLMGFQSQEEHNI